MPRPATGSLRWHAERWEVRVTLANGKRSKPIAMTGLAPCMVKPSDPERGCACSSCEMARAKAGEVSEYVRTHGVVPIGSGEVASEWFARYVRQHGDLGYDTRGMIGAWNKWAAPHFAATSISGVTTEHVKATRDALTRARHAKQISAKRAANLWSDLIKAPFC